MVAVILKCSFSVSTILNTVEIPNETVTKAENRSDTNAVEYNIIFPSILLSLL